MECTKQDEQFDMSLEKIGPIWKYDPTWPLDDLSPISPYPYTVHIQNHIYLWCLQPNESFEIYIGPIKAFWNFDPWLTPTGPLPGRGKITWNFVNVYSDPRWVQNYHNSISSKID